MAAQAVVRLNGVLRPGPGRAAFGLMNLPSHGKRPARRYPRYPDRVSLRPSSRRSPASRRRSRGYRRAGLRCLRGLALAPVRPIRRRRPVRGLAGVTPPLPAPRWRIRLHLRAGRARFPCSGSSVRYGQHRRALPNQCQRTSNNEDKRSAWVALRKDASGAADLKGFGSGASGCYKGSVNESETINDAKPC